MGDEYPICTLGDYSRLSHEGYQNTIELPNGNNVVPLRFDTIWLVNFSLKHGLVSRTYSKKSLIMTSIFGSKSKSFMTMFIPPQGEPSINRPVNDPRDISKPEKAISLPQDVPSASDCCLIELENQVQRFMEAHLAPNPPVQVNKIASSFKICSGPNDTQYCMENREQAFVDYASSRDKKVGREPFTTNQGPRNFNEASNAWKDKPNFNWA
ncbi:hypothetical protein Tco_1103627 [Tanacetum coccineum]